MMRHSVFKKISAPTTLLYFLLLIIILLPLSNGYLLNNGLINEWTARITEISSGFHEHKLYFFPTAESLITCGIYENTMNSNVWLYLPALIYAATDSLFISWGTFHLFLQAGTLLAASLFFRRVLAPAKTDSGASFYRELPATIGVLLYMTFPYRISLCYDRSNLLEAIVWMLFPLYAWAIAGILMNRRRILSGILAIITLAGIGYAHTVLYLAIAAASMLLFLLFKKWSALLSVVISAVCFAPGLLYLSRYLFGGPDAFWYLPLGSIMKNGYLFGQFFTTYAYRDYHPGMGLGMMICLFAGIWLLFVAEQKISSVLYYPSLLATGLFTLLSLSAFPWDFLQRMGTWALKLVALINTPAIFWGLALMILSLPAAIMIERFMQQKDKTIAQIVPWSVMISCLGICLYHCFTLMTGSLPLA